MWLFSRFAGRPEFQWQDQNLNPVQVIDMPPPQQLDPVVAAAAGMPPPDNEAEKEIAETVAAVAARLSEPSQEVALPVPRDADNIDRVKAAGVDCLSAAMGDFMASRLKYFCEHVDLDHPDSQEVVAAGFQPESEFNATLREIMQLVETAGGRDMTRVMALLRESFTKSKDMKAVRIAIYKPHTWDIVRYPLFDVPI